MAINLLAEQARLQDQQRRNAAFDAQQINRLSNVLGERNQNRLAQAVGNRLADDDFTGARNLAFKRGALDIGTKLDEHLSRMNERDREQFQQGIGLTANLIEKGIRGPQLASALSQTGMFDEDDIGTLAGLQPEAVMAMRDHFRGGKNNTNFGVGGVWGTDKGGKPVFLQASSSGGLYRPPVPEGVTLTEPVRPIDLGTSVQLRGGKTGANRGALAKSGSLSPDQEAIADDSGRGWAARPVPGSKLAVDRKNDEAEKERKRLARSRMLKHAGQTVLRSVTRALNDYLPNIPQGDNTVSALSRAAQAQVPGTDEFNFMRQITDFQRNIGIDKLQQMRESSPTGGALGQVPVQQQIMLQETLGSFDIRQPPPVLEENLRQLNNIYMDIMFGSAEERSRAVRDGDLTSSQNREIEKKYYATEFNEFGRRTGSGNDYSAVKTGGNESPARDESSGNVPRETPSGPQIPEAAIQFLMENPGTAEQFDEKFGEGASQRILRGR